MLFHTTLDMTKEEFSELINEINVHVIRERYDFVY